MGKAVPRVQLLLLVVAWLACGTSTNATPHSPRFEALRKRKKSSAPKKQCGSPYQLAVLVDTRLPNYPLEQAQINRVFEAATASGTTVHIEESTRWDLSPSHYDLDAVLNTVEDRDDATTKKRPHVLCLLLNGTDYKTHEQAGLASEIQKTKRLDPWESINDWKIVVVAFLPQEMLTKITKAPIDVKLRAKLKSQYATVASTDPWQPTRKLVYFYSLDNLAKPRKIIEEAMRDVCPPSSK